MTPLASRLRASLQRTGHFLFRTRNFLFPAVFLALLVLFPPPRERPHAGLEIAIGLALVVAGQGVRVVTIGFAYVKRGGKRGRIYAGDLVTEGIFSHCRNPMYLGNLFVVFGAFVMAGNPLGLAAGGSLFLFAYAAIVLAEEDYLRGRFGEAYHDYCARVPRFLPRLRGLAATLRPLPFDGRKIIAKEHGTIYLNLMLAVGLLAYGAFRGSDAELRRKMPALVAIAVFGTLAYALARVAKKRTEWLRPKES